MKKRKKTEFQKYESIFKKLENKVAKENAERERDRRK